MKGAPSGFTAPRPTPNGATAMPGGALARLLAKLEQHAAERGLRKDPDAQCVWELDGR